MSRTNLTASISIFTENMTKRKTFINIQLVVIYWVWLLLYTVTTNFSESFSCLNSNWVHRLVPFSRKKMFNYNTAFSTLLQTWAKVLGLKELSLLEYAGSILCAPFILIETAYYLCKELYLAGFLKTFISVQPLLARFFQGKHKAIKLRESTMNAFLFSSFFPSPSLLHVCQIWHISPFCLIASYDCNFP